MNKINLENYNLSKLGSVVIENLFTYDDKCSTNMINFLKKHNINQMDVDKLVKFNIYSKEYDAKYTSQYKRKLKNMLECDSKGRKIVKRTLKKIKKNKKTKKRR